MKQLSIVFLSLTIFFSTGCLENNNTCEVYSPAPVTGVSGPSTGLLFQPVTFQVQFAAGNGCGSFGNFDSYTVNDSTEVILKARYQGCVCTQQILNLTANYTFIPTRSGAHYFKYYVREGEYVRDTIWVP